MTASSSDHRKPPSSVSGQAPLWPGDPWCAYANIAPLTLRGDGSTTIASLKVLVQNVPSTGITGIAESRTDHLDVQCTTRLMKFVDDVDF